METRCLSVRQPWADLILDQGKVEIRCWNTSYRGPVLIQAGQAVEWDACRRLGIVPSATGAIIGSVVLMGTEHLTAQRWDELRSRVCGRHFEVGPLYYGDRTFGWFLADQKRFENPIPFKARLGLFKTDPDEWKRYTVIQGGRPMQSFAPGRYAGWRPGKIFGRLDCRSGQRLMSKKNRVFFLDWQDAIEAGYRPCKKCVPTPEDRY